MKLFFAVVLTLSVILSFPSALATSTCEEKDLVVVELDVAKGHEVVKINDVLVRNGEVFDKFFKSCARKTVILASPNARIYQILNVQTFLGKIGIKPSAENLFIFSAVPDSRVMTYMGTFSTIKYTKNHKELLRITENPPKESNWL
ncbi:hypothetical protein JR064_21300 [Xanthomonas sp. CFBP 8703]|uniref:Uncharacterized protein n=1 Tax=Xanthomonas bonasiae TaxID=2810351 RepID=A0ABS3B7Y3_9XANT|nr:hypothetical protein [Xanthomonas bonasiae]MBN6104705.1 hypothetical protein [Xanthomonas bonasiae]